jgi:dolichyl-phosphate-mannose-protein mannosyltransferase
MIILGLREYYELSGGFFFVAWAFHYFPFYLMDRQLFLHHYLPALYFAILLLSVTFDLACRFIPNRARLVALVLIASIAIYSFRVRAPLTYGSEWIRSECEASKVLTTWDYDCNQYPDNYAQYAANAAAKVAPIEGTTGAEEPAAIVDSFERDTDLQEQQAVSEGDGVIDAGAAGAAGAAAAAVAEQEAEDAQITDPAVSKMAQDGEIEPTFDFEVPVEDDEVSENDKNDA